MSNTPRADALLAELQHEDSGTLILARFHTLARELEASLAEGADHLQFVRDAVKRVNIVNADTLTLEEATDSLAELATSYREDYEEIRRVFHTACEKLRALEPYAVALTAPARELLALYDWRPELAEREKGDMALWGKLQSDTKVLLRQYGERKKAGWIALRAVLAQGYPGSGDPAAANAANSLEIGKGDGQ